MASCSTATLDAGAALPGANDDESWIVCANAYCNAKGYPNPTVTNVEDPFSGCVSCGPYALCPGAVVGSSMQPGTPGAPGAPLSVQSSTGMQTLISAAFVGVILWLLFKRS